MNQKEFEKRFDELVARAREILVSKGNDYANSDKLSNFKDAGKIAGLTPQQQCLSLISTKVARLGNLLKPGAKPNNESVLDSMEDLFNYAALLWMTEKEKAEYNISLSDVEKILLPSIKEERRNWWEEFFKERTIHTRVRELMIGDLVPYEMFNEEIRTRYKFQWSHAKVIGFSNKLITFELVVPFAFVPSYSSYKVRFYAVNPYL